MSLIIKPDADESEIIRLKNTLESCSYTRSVEYISREKAAEELKNALGEDFISFLGYNPLLPSLEMKLKAPYANTDSMVAIEKRLQHNYLIQEIVYQKSLVHLVNENIRKIGLALSGFGILMLIIAIVLINNTIRLSIYSRRFIIRSMQLVGATHGFIRKPFIMQGVLYGIYGSAIALGLLAGILFYTTGKIPELHALQDTVMLVLVSIAILVIGILLSVVSTYFAVGKFIRSNLDNLYQ